MNSSVSCLTQSNFYSPAFNAAIFDGPIRIYFAQYQESAALKIYFQLQEELKQLYQQGKSLYRQVGQHIFIMLYPSAETYDLSFPHQEDIVCHCRLGDDHVLGIRGMPSEDESEQIIGQVAGIIEEWRVRIPVSPEMTL
ncbi:MAG: hypothetical protein IT288_04060 [Bdellovibrionales bacterium]|nr:hypothetical protein [Bdellovibrionales bacterium]